MNVHQIKPSGHSAAEIASRVETFVRNVVVPFEKDPRYTAHGPTEDLVQELRTLARQAGVLTPHILANGAHLTQRETAVVLRKSGLSPLGPTAVNTAAPDEGNMYLLGKVANADQKKRFLTQLVAGEARSAFFMTEPAEEGGAGSDPSMMQTVAVQDSGDWVVNGRKVFITGAVGANVGIVMARTSSSDQKVAATMFLVELPHASILVDRVMGTIDSSMPGGHAAVRIDNLRVPADQILGEVHQGFSYAQVRLSPVLPKVNSLPGAQSKVSINDRDAEVYRGQCRADVRRHVISAFGRVPKQRVAIGHEPREKTLQIAAHFRVGIFLNQQRRRGMQ